MKNQKGMKIRLKSGQVFNLHDGTIIQNKSDKTKTYYLLTITSENKNSNTEKENDIKESRKQ